MKVHFRNIILFIYSFLSLFYLSAQTFTDPENLAEAVNASTDGGVFIVANGTYNDFEATFEVMATANNPVIIKAESVGEVTLTGESHFVIRKSAHVTIEGFTFDGQGEDSLIKLEGCNHIRITQNVFELETRESIKWVFIGGFWSDNTFPFDYPSHNNRIDHNIFQNKNTPGHYITVDGSFDNTGSEETYYQSQHDRIDHNYFKNNGPRAVNEQESIRIGWSEMSLSSGYTIVEHNLFEDCDGDPEIVSIKSSDNIIRHNTFRGSYGTLSLRHGNRNKLESNYFFGNGKPIGTSPDGAQLYTGGIRIYGTDHLIINNYMEGLNGTRWDAPIALTLGDAIDGQSSNLSKHFRAERVTIAFNTLVNNVHGIEIGFDNNNNFNRDLEDITIANNLITGLENSLVDIVDTDNDQGDNISWINNLMFPSGAATLLSGAISTSFDANQVINENPFLEFDTASGVWRTTISTRLLDNTLNIDPVTEDIEGQERPALSNPGADHYSLQSIRYAPLSPEDVGPTARGNTTSVSLSNPQGEVLIYPIPVTDKIYLNNINPRFNTIEIINSNGESILTQQAKNPESSIDVTQLTSGIYFIQLFDNFGIVDTYRFIVQR